MARSRRSRRNTRPSPRRWPWIVLAGLLLAVILAVVGGTILAKRYLRSEAFREFLAEKVSTALGVDGEFAPFSWTDSSVYSESFGGSGKAGIESLQAQGIRTSIDFSSFKRDAWDVEQVTINRMDLSMVPGGGETAPSQVPKPSPEPRGFLSRWIPQKVAIKGVEVAQLSYEFRGEVFVAKADDLGLTLTPMLNSDDGWQLRTLGGQVRLGDQEPMRLERLHARIRPGEVFVTDAGVEILDHAQLTTTGEIDANAGRLSFRSRIDKLRGDRVWREDWKQRLLGTIYADIKTEGRFGKETVLTHSGKVGLKNGVLYALPVLEKLANYTRTERFRRLVLDQAEADFTLEGDRLQLDNLRLRSDGLLQVEGQLTVDQAFSGSGERPLRGRLEVGVVRDVLKWLPGAEKRVFTEARAGFVWTTMNVGGTIEAPAEDLSPRLAKAAVEETIEAVPETAIETSRDLLDTATSLLDPETGEAIDGAGDQLIDQAEDVIRGGLRLVPMLDLGKSPF